MIKHALPSSKDWDHQAISSTSVRIDNQRAGTGSSVLLASCYKSNQRILLDISSSLSGICKLGHTGNYLSRIVPSSKIIQWLLNMLAVEPSMRSGFQVLLGPSSTCKGYVLDSN